MPDGYNQYENQDVKHRGFEQRMSTAEEFKIELARMTPEKKENYYKEQTQMHAQNDEQNRIYDEKQKENQNKQKETQTKFCEFFSSRGDLKELQDIQKDDGRKLIELNLRKDKILKNMPSFAITEQAKENKTKLQSELKKIQEEIEVEKQKPIKLENAFADWTKHSKESEESEEKTLVKKDDYISEYQQKFRSFKRMLESSCESKGGRRKSRKQKSKKYGKTKKSKRSKK